MVRAGGVGSLSDKVRVGGGDGLGGVVHLVEARAREEVDRVGEGATEEDQGHWDGL